MKNPARERAGVVDQWKSKPSMKIAPRVSSNAPRHACMNAAG
jgi:hypothetical protein